MIKKTFRSRAATALLIFPAILGTAHIARAASKPIVDGNARFTVVTPECIRLEYASNGKFVDDPSLFAADRSPRDVKYRVTHDAAGTVIDTGVIRLSYKADGSPFSPANLQAVVKTHGAPATWKPGMPNPGNLGGTIRTLDGADGPEDLGEGVLSRDGWYVIDDSKTPLLTKDWAKPRPSDAGSDWYLFGYGDDYKGALKSLTTISGAVPMPRRYALGAWYSRYWAFSSDDYQKIVREYAEHDFPIDNMVMDMDWHKDGWTGWSWNRKLISDPDQLLKWFHDQGLHVTLNLHPADGVGPQEDQYATFMKDMGADPASGKTIPFDAADKKYMDTLFADIFAPLEKDGVDFWWLDWQQYEPTRSMDGLTNLFWLNTLLYDRTSRDDQRGFSFSRWAGWGDQRHPIHFSGDASTSFSMLAFEVPFTSTAGNVGCFFWSHDIGGHNRGRNEESYARWVQFGATSAVLRSHSTRDATLDRRPWTYPKWAEDSMRISFHLRDEFFPYIYTSTWQSTRDTVPLNRPLYFDNPRDEKAYHNAQEYMLGDNILAAPVVTPGIGPGRVGSQTVWFPRGTWFNTFTGERYDGNSEALVAADINEFPLYARGGVPIPMQPYVERMATAPLKTLVVRCYPGENGKTGAYTLYEDDGVTTDYRKGEAATTSLSYTRSGNSVTVKIGAVKGKYAGQPSRRAYVVELPNTAKPGQVTVDGDPIDSSYDAKSFVTRVRIPERSIGKDTTVVVETAEAGTDNLRRAAMARRFEAVTGHPAATLADALVVPGLTPDQQTAAFAVAGVGTVAKNEGAYLYNGAVKGYFYAPYGVIDGNVAHTEKGGDAHLTARNEPLHIDTPEITWRNRKISHPQPVTFAVAGKPYTLSGITSSSLDLATPDNVTASAKVTASGAESGYGIDGAIDGIPGGYPNDRSQEWSAGSTIDAWLRLDWDTPQTIDRIVLYDRPNMTDQVTSGVLTFSDGSTVDVAALPNDAKTGLEVKFPAKTVTWVTFKVTGVKAGTENAGLAEIAVYRAGK